VSDRSDLYTPFADIPCIDSDIIHLSAAGLDIVILNSLDAANELFNKRSSNYSSR